MGEIFEKHKQMEDAMNFRHPWFNGFYNYLVAACIFLLCAGLWWWGMDIHTNRIAETKLADTLAAMDEENRQMIAAAEAEEAERKASQEYVMQQEATAVAKAFYGIRLFKEKYNYTERDYATYARCMFNRAEGGNLIAVISEPEQFLGYSDNNTVLSEDYNLALKLVKEWHTETTKPCDLSYKFAELTPQGIYLKQDLHADGYARRWQA